MKQPITLILTFALALSTLLSGCAKSSGHVTADYVSPLEYSKYTCPQLRRELKRVSRSTQALASKVDKNARNDKIKTTVGLLIFFPTLLFLDGDSPEARQYAHLKGQYKAIHDAMHQKQCA